MKRIYFYLFVSTILFSCKKESSKPAIQENDMKSIDGKISNWSLGSDYKIKLCQAKIPSSDYVVLDSAIIDNEGRFNITLSTIPALGAINFGDSVQISDNSARISTGLLWLTAFSKNNKIIGGVVYGKLKDSHPERSPGDVGVGYFYADKDVQISSATSGTILNLSFRKAWNRCVQRFITDTKTEVTTDMSETNLAGAQWLLRNY